MADEIQAPLDVPEDKRDEYKANMERATHNTGRLMLFAGDQKVEHLNKDFKGEGIAEDDADGEHLFRIASRAKIGVFATQMGLIAQYGRDYKDVPYLVKLNSKTNALSKDFDPRSHSLYSVADVVRFKETSGLPILAVGYTVYVG